MEPKKCTCGLELRPYQPDMADGSTGLESIPCYSEFVRFWEGPDQAGHWDSPEDKEWIAAVEQDWQSGGLWAANVQDALDTAVNQTPTFHDVLSSDGTLLSRGNHTPRPEVGRVVVRGGIGYISYRD